MSLLVALIGVGAGALLPTGQAQAQVSADTPGWFPFVMLPMDNPEASPVDLSFLNTAGTQGRISIRDGRFIDPAGGRVRFLGTNVTFSAAFPEKEHAAAISRRLAQLGFNVVRFHHMDARDIWLPGQKALDPAKLDRLDWFIRQLKQNGVYSNINLHVSRTYPGLRELDLPRAYRYGKVLDKFHDPYIELQEQYATDLLAHTNPYTGLALAHDPAIAFVELNNENTMLGLGPGEARELPELFRSPLLAKWRRWLTRTYKSLKTVTEIWNEGVVPLGDELLRNHDFGQGLEDWSLEGRKPGVCDVAVVADGAAVPAIRITMQEEGKVSWAYQLHQLDVPVANGTDYTIRFRARSEPPRDVSVGLRFAEAPWTFVSGRSNCRLTPEWKDVVLPVHVEGVEGGVPVRLSVNMGAAVGMVELAGPSLRSGRELFRPGDARSLEDLDFPETGWPPATVRDFRRFLVDTEKAYVRRLRKHLTQKLGVESLVVDSQASYGGYWGLHREATLCDFIDMHAYWQHPRFPGKPWDGANWNIPNTSMVAAEDGGTLARLAHYRLRGKPYTVSEYNHPAPNDYAAELFPMVSAFAAHQDWDGVYQFCYGNRTESLTAGKVSSYFSLAQHSAQLVFAPIAALLFRGGAVPPGPGPVRVGLPVEHMDKGLATAWPDYRNWLSADVLPYRAVLGNRYEVEFTDAGPEPVVPPLPKAPEGGDQIATPHLTWQATGDAPRFTVNAPAVRCAVGRIAGESIELGDVRLKVDMPAGTWVCAALASVDSRSIADSARVLLSLATRIENTNMGWDAERKSVGKKWGSAPVVAQGVPAEIILPGDAAPRVWALDPRGEKSSPISVSRTGNGWQLVVGPQYRTLWYVIER